MRFHVKPQEVLALNWLFGRSRRAEQSAEQLRQQMDQLTNQVRSLKQALDQQNQTLASIIEAQEKQLQQQQELQAQTAKSAQLQYRWTQQQNNLLEAILEQQEEADTHAELLGQSIAAHVQLLDDVSTAMRHLQAQSGSGTDQTNANQAWTGVLRQWQQRLHSTLEQLNVEPLDPVGQIFDAKLAEAGGTVSPSEAAEYFAHHAQSAPAPYTIVETLRLGYRWNGRILRKALVVTVNEEESPDAQND